MTTGKKRKNIHHHIHLFSRMHTVVVIFGALVCVALFVWIAWGTNVPTTQNDAATTETPTSTVGETRPVELPENSASPEELAKEYREQINAAIGTFDFQDAGRAQDVLYTVLELRVPAELKNFHLQVVVALNAAVQGKAKQATQRIETLKKEYAWFLVQ